MKKIQLLFFTLFFFNQVKADHDVKLSGIFLLKFQINIYKNLYCGPIFGAGVDSKGLVGCGIIFDKSKDIINYLSINYMYFLTTNKHSISLDFIIKYFFIFRIIYRSDGFFVSVGLNFIEKILSKKAIVNASIALIQLIPFEKNRNDNQNNLNEESNAQEGENSYFDVNSQEIQNPADVNTDAQEKENSYFDVNSQEVQNPADVNTDAQEEENSYFDVNSQEVQNSADVQEGENSYFDVNSKGEFTFHQKDDNNYNKISLFNKIKNGLNKLGDILRNDIMDDEVVY